MKLIITLSLLLFVFVSCQKDEFQNNKKKPEVKPLVKKENLLDSIQPAQEFDAPFVYSQDGNIYFKRILKSATGKELETKTFSQPINSELEFTVFINHINKDYKDMKVKIKPNTVFQNKGEWTTDEQILVVSDYEGEFFQLVDLLISAQVIDENYNWKFGNKHLVFLGDAFDRGTMVHEILWLLYKLESEGANIHFLFGNHDIMNISGNQTNYIDEKYKEELKPLGFEGIEDLYKENTILGGWLRQQNVIEKGNDILFVHGGISEVLFTEEPNMNISKVNEIVQKNLNDPKNPESAPYLRSNSALTWYRGYFRNPKQDPAFLEEVLSHFKARLVCVAHTIQKQAGLSYNGKVAGTDVDIHNGQKEGLIFDKKDVYRIEVKNKNTAAVKTKL